VNPIPKLTGRALACGLAAASLLAAHGAALAQETYALTTLRASSIQVANPAGQWGLTRGGYLDQSSALNPVVSSALIESYGYGSADGGYANASALAWAEAGAVGATAMVEVQARAQLNGYSGGDASAEAKAYFEDMVTFTAPSQAPGTLLKVTGELRLTGTAFNDRSSLMIWGTGTGLNLQQPNNVWKLVCGTGACIYTDPHSNRSDWVAGTPLTVPYQFYVTNGQAASVGYSMDISVGASVSYDPCIADGGICVGAQFDDKRGGADFSHTLAWGGATVTTEYGADVGAFTAIGHSGFDYSQPYAPVPEPAAWALMLAGLTVVLRRSSRGAHTGAAAAG
jgi:hypothetical protein